MAKAIQSISIWRGAWGMAAAHPLKTVFVLALLVRLINIALLKGNDSFFAEADSFLYWQLGAGLANPSDDGGRSGDRPSAPAVGRTR